MGRLFGVVGLTVGALSWGALSAHESARGPGIRVMAFNLRYASDRAPNSWQARRPVVAWLLRAERPDIIGTQEGVYSQLKDVAQDAPEYDWIGLGRDGGSRGEFMAVFYRARRFEPLAFDHFWLSDTPEVVASSTWGNTNRRMVTWVRFRDREVEEQFYVFNTHFDHEVSAAREKSAALLLARLGDLAPALPIIVTGDFNAAAGDSKPYATLVGEGGLRDAWIEASKGAPPFGTFHGFRGPRRGAPRIDWILLRGAVAARASEIVTFAVDGQFPSDHFPVTAVVEFPSAVIGGPAE